MGKPLEVQILFRPFCFVLRYENNRELVSYIPKPIFKGIATGVYKDLFCGIFALEIFLKIEIFIGLFICLALALSLFIAKSNKDT